MKIGIITFHRAHNYGAILQCFALQKAIQKFSHDVFVIDYRQKQIEKSYYVYGLKDTLSLFLKPKKLLIYLKNLPKRIKGAMIFNKFQKEFLNLTKPCSSENIPISFDRYVIGSDQLWVPQLTGGDLDKIYQGYFGKKSLVYTYAISTNQISIKQIGEKEIFDMSKNFSCISIREQNVLPLLSPIVAAPIRVDIDPTLLLDSSEWEFLLDDKWKNENKYILTYHLPGRYKNLSKSIFDKKIKYLAKQKKCNVINLYPMKYSVTDFLSLLKYAEGIVTTSFHATVFALIFQKKLMSIVTNDGNDGRYIDLLKKVGATSAITDLNFEVKDFQTLNYDIINENLKKYREPSLVYLHSIIK